MPRAHQFDTTTRSISITIQTKRQHSKPTNQPNQPTSMSKPFDYSKWDNIEISDDEDDVHPNIDKESWFRLKHRSRVEREENEEKDKAQIRAQVRRCVQASFFHACMIQWEQEKEKENEEEIQRWYRATAWLIWSTRKQLDEE